VIVGSKRRQRAGLGLRYAVLVGGAALMVIPFAYMLATSFKPHAFIFELPPDFVPDEPTLSNYRDAWTSSQFDRYFVNSLVVAVATTVISVFVSAMMAYAFARFQFPGKRLLFGLLLIGLMVPTVMLIIPQFVLARTLGVIDSLHGLVLFYVATTVSLNTFLLRGFFEEIPDELEDAMLVDGATAWRRFWTLFLPLAKPALATVAIFSFLASWDEFVWALTIINDPDKRTLPIAIALFQGQHVTSWGLVFAASTIAVVPVVVVFLAFQRYFVSGLTAGAVKG
jgi:ABC-type glycerol-3-phosphate transport system permease component